MPTLIRLFAVLALVAALGFVAMFALSSLVDPGEREMTIKIPARKFTASSAPAGPTDLDNLPPPVNVAPPTSETPAADGGGDVRTVARPE